MRTIGIVLACIGFIGICLISIQSLPRQKDNRERQNFQTYLNAYSRAMTTSIQDDMIVIRESEPHRDALESYHLFQIESAKNACGVNSVVALSLALSNLLIGTFLVIKKK